MNVTLKEGPREFFQRAVSTPVSLRNVFEVLNNPYELSLKSSESRRRHNTRDGCAIPSVLPIRAFPPMLRPSIYDDSGRISELPSLVKNIRRRELIVS